MESGATPDGEGKIFVSQNKLSCSEKTIRQRDPRVRDEALAQSNSGKPLIDVRSPGEFKGDVTHMPEYPQEGVLRGGHIPGAKSMPWKTATNEDNTFKSAPDLAKIYFEQCGVKSEIDTVVYCRIGERSSHTGLCSPICSVSITCAITTARGRSGGTK